MEKENFETVPSENEEEPQVFSVARDVNGSHFNRRDCIEKAVVTSAAVTVVAAGCAPRGVSPEDVQAAIQATENAGKLTEIAGVSVEKEVAQPTDTPSPTNTATSVPTNTREPATATVTRTPKPKGIETTIKGDNVNFRSGPGTGYAPITRLPQGAPITLTGRLADSSWVGVALADPKRQGVVVQGWIKTNLVNTTGKDIQSLPVVTDIPPTPTPLPGRYGNTKPGTTGIDYSYTDEYGNVYNLSLSCGSTIPPGATCTCNCVTVPVSCSCVDHSAGGCTCDVVHYWYPN